MVKAIQRKLLYLTMAALRDAFGEAHTVKGTRCKEQFYEVHCVSLLVIMGICRLMVI